MRHRATYSPEDNKLRFYPDWSDGEFDKEIIKAAGYRWASKQECYVCPRWTPTAEDYALKFADEIEEEDYTAAERSADRADRFEGYRDKRADEAGASADAFDAGPQAFGHQNRNRAERQAARHDRLRVKSVNQWRKAEYWQERTRGVIRAALYRLRPEVRRTRIKGLEADERKHAADMQQAVLRRKGWARVLTLEGADRPISDETPAGKLAYALAANGYSWHDFTHPTTGAKTSLYSMLTDPQHPITAEQAARLYLENVSDPEEPESYFTRWAEHYQNRLAYERAMLAEEGGAATDLEMVAGGWLGNMQIVRVSKSTATGKPSSVVVRKDGREHRINLERLGENVYRAPTPEELEQFQESEKAHRKAVNAAKPKAPPLINPTKEDAERLQAQLNAWYAKTYQSSKPSEVIEMTQAEYSERSRGSYSPAETQSINERGITNQMARHSRKSIFRVRMFHSRALYAANRVVILTDQPQKPIPWKEIEETAARMPSADSLRPRMVELVLLASRNWQGRDWTEEETALFDDAIYAGLAYSSSTSQFGLTEAGKALAAEEDAYGKNLKSADPGVLAVTEHGTLFDAKIVAAARAE